MASSKTLVRLDGHILRSMIIAGTNKLVSQKARINALNVFPVPDGDTGTNMALTAIAAAKEVEHLDTSDVFAVSKAAASGALRGGRGNSGVIFSQLFRGFSKAIEGNKTISIRDFALALEGASKTAYKAVMRPQEGTMLTVARHMAESAKEIANDAYGTKDMQEFLMQVLEAGKRILKRTPDMLPVLKQAGVVDSGGEGLIAFFGGAIAGMYSDQGIEGFVDIPEEDEHDFSALAHVNPEDIEFGYCTEFFINVNGFTEPQEDEFKAYLETMGDSIALVSDDEIVKIHVHTNNPGTVMERAMTIGPLSHIKIDNMRFQHHSAISFIDTEERKGLAIVAIASGDGFKRVFEDLGVSYVIEGGQTMNPSAEDIRQAIRRVKADNVIVLINNKNITLAAEQAKAIAEEEDGIAVHNIYSRSIPQGISAMVAFMPDVAVDTNVAAMSNAITEVITGQLTHAVRDTSVDGKDIKEGDYIALIDGDIVGSNKHLMPLATSLIDKLLSDGHEVLAIYPGADAYDEDTDSLIKHVRDNHPHCELQTEKGGQPIYYYILSAE